jgi:hypothetical protein
MAKPGRRDLPQGWDSHAQQNRQSAQDHQSWLYWQRQRVGGNRDQRQAAEVEQDDRQGGQLGCQRKQEIFTYRPSQAAG